MGGVTDPLYKKICSLRPVTKSRGWVQGRGVLLIPQIESNTGEFRHYRIHWGLSHQRVSEQTSVEGLGGVSSIFCCCLWQQDFGPLLAPRNLPPLVCSHVARFQKSSLC